MPVVVPPFVQYQAPLVPLRGLWNKAPKEGDRFIQAEINWTVTTKAGNAVQFELSGNSPVAFSQLVALMVDNSHCAVSTVFLFPDSGSELVVPAFNQGLYPVITNALMFYVFAVGAVLGDRTILQALNSLPPPLAIQPYIAPPSPPTQNAAATGIALNANATTAVIAAGISGTLTGFSVNISCSAGAAAAFVNVSLADGTGKTLWSVNIEVPINQSTNMPNDLSGLNLKFSNGVNIVVFGSTGVSNGFVVTNLYYTVP